MGSPRAPDHLGGRGRRFWHAAWERWRFDDAEREILIEACRVLTVMEDLEETVREDGPLAEGSTGQPVAHPALRELRQQRKLFAQLLRQLDLPDLIVREAEEDEGPKSPPRPAGESRDPRGRLGVVE